MSEIPLGPRSASRVVMVGGFLVLVALASLVVRPAFAEVKWRSGEVSSPQPMKPAELRQAITQLAERPQRRRIVIHFAGPLESNRREALEASGVRLTSYLGGYAYVATLTDQIDPAKASTIRGLLAVEAIDPTNKLHPDLAAGIIHPWSIVGPASPTEPTVAVYVLFHRDVDLRSEAPQVVGRHAGTIDSYIHAVNGVVAHVAAGRVAGIADEDSVMYIEPPLPKLTEINDSNLTQVGADLLQSPPYGLDGSGIDVLVYDSGKVYQHGDLAGRLTIGASDTSYVRDHATHVACTLAGDGSGSAGQYMGMAPAANIISFGFEQQRGVLPGFLYTDPGDIEADYGDAIAFDGADLSNNSIGSNTASNGYPCAWEGNYGVTGALIDEIARGFFGNPFRIVWANGNERNSGRCGTTYLTTAPPACAKNHITVGALNSDDDSVTSFTSWGPCDDGRLKPDISGPGCQVGGDATVTSCSSSGGYTGKCGTSMASPTVAGISALLLQQYRMSFPGEPDFRNSTLKAILAQTAVDLVTPGPDFQSGYGSVRAKPAADLIIEERFLEAQTTQGATYTFLVRVGPEDDELKVTLAWDDPAGTPDVNPALVNDLDLRVLDGGGTVHYPWTLDPANPADAAVRTQRDGTNNIEQVVIDDPAPGAYTVEIIGFNVAMGPSQSFSVAASPSLINCGPAGAVSTDTSRISCDANLGIRVRDCDLDTDFGLVETVDVIVTSSSEPGGETVTLTESGAGTATFLGSIQVATSDTAGVLLVGEGETITVSYLDADDGAGGVDVPVVNDVIVDCTNPSLTDLTLLQVIPGEATIITNANEPVRVTLPYGLTCGSWISTTGGDILSPSHQFTLTGLTEGATYYYVVELEDEAGNVTVDDNAGACHSFLKETRPIAGLTGAPRIGTAPLSVIFNDGSQFLPTLWTWDFEDDGVVDSTVEEPTHIYLEPGMYSVKLVVENGAGSDVALAQDYIWVFEQVQGEVTGLVIGTDESQLLWDPGPDTCSYDLVRGDLMLLVASGGDFGLSASQVGMGCLAEGITSPEAVDVDNPAPGEGFYYLVRGVDCSEQAGTYDTSFFPWQPESRDPQLQGPSTACTCEPSDDIDADGFCSALDNCPDVFNVDQDDTDADDFGDACDCDINNPYCMVTCLDSDADGFCETTDCDDLSPDTFPGAAPNDAVDECMADVDGDDWGDADPPPGTTAGSDCDDGNIAVNPNTVWHADSDGDGFGDPATTLVQCAQPEGYVLDNTDCDDEPSACGALCFPGNPELDICDGYDNDCDLLLDEEPVNCDDGPFCGGVQTCSAGVCEAGPAVDCSAFNDQCNVGVCNETTDQCEAQAINEGNSCSDGSACSVGETCNSGVCGGGAAVNCSGTGDACNADNTCDPGGLEGNCDTAGGPTNEGGNCDDGLFCTTGVICSAGACVGADEENLPPDSELSSLSLIGDTAGDCNTNDCVIDVGDDPDAPDGNWAVAVSNQVNTEIVLSFPTPAVLPGVGPDLQEFRVQVRQFDTAQTGTPLARIELWENGLLVRAGEDQPVVGTGEVHSFTWDAAELGTADGSLVEIRVVGKKASGSPSVRNAVDIGAVKWNLIAADTGGGLTVDCSAFDDQCNIGVCNEATDACEAQPANEGSSCDDGSACNVGETCTSGVCGGGVVTDCSAFDDQCNLGLCNDATGACEAQPANEGSSCDDGLACSVGETCTSGVCGGAAAVDCSVTGDACNADSTCDPGGLEGNCDTAGGFINESGACDDGDVCNVGETCTSGVCGGGATADCSGTGDACNADSACDPGGLEGNCDTAGGFINESGTCDDEDACNVGETCTSGVCGGGTAADCSGTGDACNAESTCDPGGLEGNCDTAGGFVNESGACDDDDACNVGETCTSGTCGGGAVADCSGTGDACNADSTCDPGGLEGNCDAAGGFINESGACDDGDVCNVGETCTSGVCGGGAVADCSGSGDACNADSTCDPGGLEGNCDTAGGFINESGSCDDGDVCNVGETCTSGVCGGGAAADCSGTGDACNADNTCDLGGLEGNCDTAGGFINESGSCDDGLACSVGETCTAGVCGGGVATDCSTFDDQCNVGVCNETTGACETQPANEGNSCDDGLACSVGETCTSGVCGGGTAADCSSTGDACNADSTCDPGGLEGNCDTAGGFINESGACDDGDACNVGEICTSGVCGGAAAMDCSGTGDACNADSTCDPGGLEGNCDTAGGFINESGACDDGDVCNVGETCTSGVCGGGAVADCSGTGDACNADSTCDPGGLEGNCDTAGGFINESGACDDEDACNVGETCTSGVCGGGTAADCSGTGDACNAESTCDPGGPEGNCDTAGGFVNESGACDDDDACNVGETCTSGTCGGGAVADCSGTGDACNADSTCDPGGLEGNCDAAGGFINESGACDDSDVCNVGETCTSGVCGGGAAADCSGTGDACNDDSICDPGGLEGNCDTAGGFVNESGACDDDDVCNVGETCTSGVCGGGAAADCSGTGDACNADNTCDIGGLEGNCDTAGGSINESGACDDGLACSVGETCTAGVCGGGVATDCSTFDDQCNVGVCNETTGACETQPANEGNSCDDGLACSVGETCNSGLCGDGTAADCSGTGDACNAESTCDPGGLEGNCDTAGGFINESGACDDGDACNVGEICTSGVCGGAAAMDCSGTGDACNADSTCDPGGLEGNCDTGGGFINESGSCDDGDVCNVGETCTSGVCGGGATADCSGTGDACNADSACDPGGLEGNCDTAGGFINESGACDDEDVCNVGETCTSGVCGGGTAADCSGTGDACNTDSTCDPGGLEGNCDTAGGFVNESGACDDDDACNVGEICTSGTCGGGAAADCSGTGDACNAESTCDPGGLEGNCDATGGFINESGACDDSDVCNVGETCTSGVCGGGAAADCSGTGDACNADSTCDPGGLEGNCDTAGGFVNESGACDDDDACNVGETCTSGVCGGGTAADCSGTGDACNADSTCDPGGLEGNCDTAGGFINESGACDDGDVCNVGEICTSGVCGGGADTDCSSFDDQCNVGVCNETTGACEVQPANEGNSCDDGLACSVGETCISGLCGDGTAADCSGTGDACNADSTCDPGGLEGNCDTAGGFINESGACDDGDACNVGETCTSGVCGGGTASDCSGTGDACNADNTCDPGGLEGNCDTAGGFINESGACDDDDACNVGETCTSGVCGGGAAADCSGTGDACNADSTCDSGGLEGNCDTAGGFINESGACDDGDVCNVGETCTSGVCGGGAAADCSGTGDACNADSTCDSGGLEGNCDTAGGFINESGSCDDGDVCNVGEACTSGVCGGGATADCSGTGDACNADSTCDPGGLEGNCDTAGGFINESGACDDSDVCNVGETCTSGVCGGGAAADCSGTGDACNADNTCDPGGLEGNCDTVGGFINESGACDDDDACNVGETCTSGVCGGGTAADCSGTGDACNADSTCDPGGLEGNCDTAGGFINESGACDDGDVCNVGEICTSGVCGGGADTDCSSFDDQCNVGVCNETTGACEAQPANDGNSCDDGLACSVGETCTSGACGGGTAADCSGTGDACNADSTCDPGGLEGNCDTAGGFINESGSCDDSDACNVGETCTSGVCGGGAAADCSGTGDACNADSTCDPGGLEGNCDTAGGFINESGSCDDSDACNVGETCASGVCGGGAAADCSGTGDACNADSTCDPGGLEGNCDTAGGFINESGTCDDLDACTVGETCTAGVCGNGTAPLISDVFSGSGTPPSGWTEINGSWAEGGGTLSLDTATDNSLVYYSSETTCALDQWVRVEYSDVGTTNGAALRQVSTDDTVVRYVVTYNESSGDVVWSYCTGSTPSCTSIESFASSFLLVGGDSLGFQVTGTGSSTVIEVWKNPVGAAPSAWGSADWTSSNDPGAGNYADSGQYVGLYIGSGAVADRGSFDNFEAGSP